MWHRIKLKLSGMIGLIGIALSGCVALTYDLQSFDSPRPGGEPWDQTPTCIDQPAGTHVECLVLVRADQWHSATGTPVLAQHTYRIRVPDARQTWFDAERVNKPLCGEDGSWIMRLYNSKRRNTEAKWFSVQATVLAPDKRPNAVRKEMAEKPVDLCVEGMSSVAYFTPATSGELALFPNDAIGSAERPAYFYGNNAGQVWLAIQSCEDECLKDAEQWQLLRQSAKK